MADTKALIFDCFGVIYPQATGEFFAAHSNKFSDNPGILDELNLKIDLGKISQAEFFKGLEAVSGIPDDEIQAEIDSRLKPDKNLVLLIERLRSKYKIALLSNAGEDEIEVLYRDGLDKLFDDITISYRVGFQKPNPEIFQVCINNLGVTAAECLFIDDSKMNINAAAQLSIQTLLYPEFGVIPEQLSALAV